MNKFFAVILALGFSASALAQSVGDKPAAPAAAAETGKPAAKLAKKQVHKAKKKAKKAKKFAKKTVKTQDRLATKAPTPAAVK